MTSQECIKYCYFTDDIDRKKYILDNELVSKYLIEFNGYFVILMLPKNVRHADMKEGKYTKLVADAAKTMFGDEKEIYNKWIYFDNFLTDAGIYGVSSNVRNIIEYHKRKILMGLFARYSTMCTDVCKIICDYLES